MKTGRIRNRPIIRNAITPDSVAAYLISGIFVLLAVNRMLRGLEGRHYN